MGIRDISRRSKLKHFLIGTGVLVTLAFGGVWFAWPSALALASSGDASIPNLTGAVWFNSVDRLSDDDLRGRTVLYEYWATWCAPCVGHIPKLNRIQKNYRDQGLIVIAVTNDSPNATASFVKRFKMEYAVCSVTGFIADGEFALPYAILVSPQGTVLWQGDARFAAAPIALAMRGKPTGKHVSLLRKGNIIGYSPNRPASLAKYDFATLREKLDALLEHPGEITVNNLEKLYPFFWKNLPQEDWEGDEETRRRANGALFEIYIGIRKSSPQDILKSLAREMLKRINDPRSSSSDRIDAARVASYAIPVGDNDGIESLKRILKKERNPLVRKKIVRALDRIDPSRVVPPPPESALSDAKDHYKRVANTWKTKVFGLPSDLRAFQAYQTENNVWTSGVTKDLAYLDRLMQDYHRHNSNTPGDLLIREHILSVAGTLPHMQTLTKEVSRELQKRIFEIAKQPEPDPVLRYRILGTLDGVRFDSIDHNELLKLIEKELSNNPYRDLATVLEYMRLQIVDPAALD